MNTETTAADVAEIDITDEQAQKYIESRGEVELEQKQEVQEEVKTEEVQEVTEEVKDEKKKPPEGFVKHEALHEERMRRKELQQKIQMMESRFQEVVNNLKPKEETKVPAFEENPAEHLRLQQEHINKSVAEQQQFIQQQRQAAEHHQRTQAMLNVYSAKAAEYQQSNKEFPDAYKFLLESRKNEYLAVGYSLDQVNLMIEQDELAIVHKAFEDEVNPAERIFNIAKARGYQAKKVTPQQKIESIDKGVKASKTLSSVSGASPKGLTLEAIAEMSDEEFDKIDYSEIRRLGLSE